MARRKEEEKESIDKQFSDANNVESLIAQGVDVELLKEKLFKDWEMLDEDAIKEAEKFHAYNANKGWTCLPEWEKAADLWIARIND